jgi:uncharacterized small protein (TIGR04563 family)
MGKTVDQALWYPSVMLEEMQSVAETAGHSVAWVVDQTWSRAKAEVAKLDGSAPWRAEKVFDAHYADSDKVKHMLALPASMMDEVKAEAARLDRSMSWLVARAWCVARDQLGQSNSATTGA